MFEKKLKQSEMKYQEQAIQKKKKYNRQNSGQKGKILLLNRHRIEQTTQGTVQLLDGSDFRNSSYFSAIAVVLCLIIIFQIICFDHFVRY